MCKYKYMQNMYVVHRDDIDHNVTSPLSLNFLMIL